MKAVQEGDEAVDRKRPFLCGGVPRTESGKKLQQSYLATFRRRSILPIKGTGDSDMRASRLSHAKRERFHVEKAFSCGKQVVAARHKHNAFVLFNVGASAS